MKTAAEVLGVQSNATPTEVRSAYRDLARRLHPDRWATADLQTRREAEDLMKGINAAYRELSQAQPEPQLQPKPHPRPQPPPSPSPVDAATAGRVRRPHPPPPGRAYRCTNCGLIYDLLEPLCSWCYWPQPSRSRERAFPDHSPAWYRRRVAVVAVGLGSVLVGAATAVSQADPFGLLTARVGILGAVCLVYGIKVLWEE